MKKIRPLQDRILVKRLEEHETKKGGIIIPDTAKEKPQEGEVIAVGPGTLDEHGKRIPMEVKVGDMSRPAGLFLTNGMRQSATTVGNRASR